MKNKALCWQLSYLKIYNQKKICQINVLYAGIIRLTRVDKCYKSVIKYICMHVKHGAKEAFVVSGLSSDRSLYKQKKIITWKAIS